MSNGTDSSADQQLTTTNPPHLTSQRNQNTRTHFLHKVYSMLWTNKIHSTL